MYLKCYVACHVHTNVAPHLSLPTHPSASPYYSHTIFSPTQSQYSPSVHAGGGGASVQRERPHRVAAADGDRHEEASADQEEAHVRAGGWRAAATVRQPLHASGDAE